MMEPRQMLLTLLVFTVLLYSAIFTYLLGLWSVDFQNLLNFPAEDSYWSAMPITLIIVLIAMNVTGWHTFVRVYLRSKLDIIVAKEV